MRILYISVHEPLQFDEVSLFESLGAEVFVGNKLGTRIAVKETMRPSAGVNVEWSESTLHDYDAVIVMHDWQALWRVYAARAPGQRIIWRSIGQSIPYLERSIRAHCPNVEIVRYSPRERNIGGWYAGESAIIRFYKDDQLPYGMIGGGGITLISSRFGKRNFPDHTVLEEALEGRDWKLYGNNPDHPKSAGFLDHNDMLHVTRSADLFIATHSMPACYTLNLIEAMMAGVPVAAVGREVLERFAHHVPDAPGLPAAVYEVDEILKHGSCGVLVASPEHGRYEIGRVLKNRSRAEDLASAARERAVELFGRTHIKEQWRQFLSL